MSNTMNKSCGLRKGIALGEGMTYDHEGSG